MIPRPTGLHSLPHAESLRVNLTDATGGGEHELLARLRTGEEAAFATIFRTHYGALVGRGTRIRREGAVAAELAPEARLDLWRRRDTRVPGRALGSYLHRAPRTRGLNRLRPERPARRGEPYVRPPGASPDAD